jgi:acetyl esterase/lipase
LLLHVGADELLFADAQRFAERVQCDGGLVRLLVWDQALHAWFRWIDEVPDGAQALKATAEWMQERLQGA